MDLKEDRLDDSQMEMVKGFCEEFGTTYEDVKRKFKKHPGYSWMGKVLPHKKRITFRDLCDLVDRYEFTPERLYSDYEYMCNYIHAQDIKIKLSGFTFYETIFSIFFNMVNYVRRTLLLVIDEESDAYQKLMKLEEKMDYNIAYLHDEILGKYKNIDKILEEVD